MSPSPTLCPKTDVKIHLQAWFPCSILDWNGRFIGVGGGGFAAQVSSTEMHHHPPTP
jgi:hypothetical protein